AHRRGTGMAALLAERLGGVPTDSVPCGVALGIPPDRSVATLQRWIDDALAHGYRRVKTKVAPGWDAQPVGAARRALKETRIPLTVDANGGCEWPRHEPNLAPREQARRPRIQQP